MRPELMRAEIPSLYHQLPHIPGVMFSANSATAAKAYAEWLEFDFSRFVVIPNSIEDFTKKPFADSVHEDRQKWEEIEQRSPECSKTVLGVFRYDDNKRPMFWAKVAAKYAAENPDTRFVIVGKGKLEADTVRTIGELNAENRVFVVGASRAVPFWLEKADLLMHLARMEGLPNVVIESQISGTPVLSTPAGGVPEIVYHGETGFILSDAHDPSEEEILGALDRMLSDSEELGHMASRARELSCARHDPNKVLDLTFSLFSSKWN